MTYVEMTARDQFSPAALVPGLSLDPMDHESPLVRQIQARIGAPYGWRSASRTEEEWVVWSAEQPGRMCWLLSLEGQPAGMLAYDLRPGGEVEIKTFGLLPEFVGKGLGAFALTLGVQRAWELAPSVSRVWLHTSTFDHPHALPNYHRRGFRTFKTEECERGLGRVEQAGGDRGRHGGGAV